MSCCVPPSCAHANTSGGKAKSPDADVKVLSRTCPSGKSGGSLGEFGPGQMVKEFNDVVFTTGTVGKVSPLPCATLRAVRSGLSGVQ